MKKLFLAIALLVTGISTYAANGMVFTQTFTDAAGQKSVLTWYVADVSCKLKLELTVDGKSTTNWFIPNQQQRTLQVYTEGEVVSGAQKTYFKLPIDEVQPSKEMVFSRISVEKTGETKDINGLKCEKVIVKTNKNETEMWVTTGFTPSYYQFHEYFKDNIALTALAENRIAGFPVELVTKTPDGKVVFSFTLNASQAKELSAEDFKVPAEYKSPE